MNDDEMLRAALEMSMEQNSEAAAPVAVSQDISAMTEDEQIAYALQMSMQTEQSPMQLDEATEEQMDTDDQANAEFLQTLLENLPGADGQNDKEDKKDGKDNQ